MKKLIIITVFVFCFSILISGCTSNAPTTGKEGDTATDAVKTLTFAIAAETDLLSPLYMGNSNFCTTKMVYENLVNYEDGEIVPGLAERWEVSDDGKSITFHLRKNVVFHDGEPLNSEAVKLNLEHKKSNPAMFTLKAMTDIEEIEILDDTTLTLHYSHPYFAYLNDFCWPDVMPIVSPNILLEGDFQTVVDITGTGPYTLDQRESGQYTRFLRNESYWGERPYYDEIIVKYIPDASSRLQALKTGEIDLIYGSALLSYEDYQQAIQISGIKGQMAESDTRARDITLNTSQPVLSDLRVRQAIAYAIDKESISQGLTYGYEKIANIPFTLDAPFCDVKLNTIFTYDKEKANSLLEEAGWEWNQANTVREKNGVPLSILLTMDASFDSLNKSMATLLKGQLAEVGIDMSIKSQEQMEWYADFVEGNFDITIWQPQYAFASPHCWFTPMSVMTPQTPSLKGLIDSQEFLKTIEEFTTEDDPERLNEIFTYLINYNLDNVIDIPLTYSKDMVVYNSDKIKGYTFKGTPCFFDVTQLEER